MGSSAAVFLLLPFLAAAEEEAGLSLPYFLDAALEHNRDLIQARERIEQVDGDRVVVRSRFMPSLDLTANYDALRTELDGDIEDHVASRLRFSQRLFEFGPNAAQEIRLRADLREAVYGYQGKVYEVTARVWELFQLILLGDEQIAVRQQSRDNFDDIRIRQREKFDVRLASEEAVLEAELDVLTEELEINRLIRQQLNRKSELLRLSGQTIGTQITVTGQFEPFTVDQDEAVAIALERDVQISLDEELLEEQQRVVRELGWQYAPDLSLSAGVEDGRRNARLSVDKENQTWGVNMASEFALDERDPASGLRGDSQWFAQVEARIPIFEGASRIGRETVERARLRATLLALRDRREGVELNVRQAFQSMLEAEEEQRIQKQRVTIARRRLEINQFLKDKGQADEVKVEQVRQLFFNAQASLFRNQETYISRQAALRRLVGYLD